MRDDLQEITEPIRAWVSVVRAGEPEGASAHAEDIVMFDVPPPDNGVRGDRCLSCDLAAVLRMASVWSFVRHRRAGRDGGRRAAYAWALLRWELRTSFGRTRTTDCA